MSQTVHSPANLITNRQREFMSTYAQYWLDVIETGIYDYHFDQLIEADKCIVGECYGFESGNNEIMPYDCKACTGSSIDLYRSMKQFYTYGNTSHFQAELDIFIDHFLISHNPDLKRIDKQTAGRMLRYEI